ncbi:MAG: NUDIX domain-containing protein [Myxococcota bacterium]
MTAQANGHQALANGAARQHHCAGGIVAVATTTSWQYLVMKRQRTTGRVEWVAPKGHLESGETSLTAARREIVEETGLTDLHMLKPVGTQQFSFKGLRGRPHEKQVDWYVFVVGDTNVLRLNGAEGFVEARWLPYEQARALFTHSGFLPFLQRARDVLRRHGSGS